MGMRAYDDVEGTKRDWIAEPSVQHEESFFYAVSSQNVGDQQEIINQAAEEAEIDPGTFQGKFNTYIKELEVQRANSDIRTPSKAKTGGRKKKTDSWWNGNTFIPPNLANVFMKENRFIYDRGEIYYYQDGVYRPDGDHHIKYLVRQKLGEDYRKHRGEEVIDNIKTELQVSPTHLDANPSWINLSNGLLYWQNRELNRHTPDVASTIRIPVQYNPSTTCPKIEKFLKEVLPPDCLEFIYEVVGYLLIPDTRFERAFMLVGQGANGKSTFLKLLKAFLGDRNVSSESLQDIAENRFRAGNLAGKLANIFPDLDSRAIGSTGNFKALVSGDAISVEKKYRDAFKLENRARMIFSCNEIPRSYDNSPAFYRRLVLIRFPNTFPPDKADPGRLDKLITDEEFSGLLNKALEGLVRLFDRGRFVDPESTQEELTKYREDNENVKVFIDEWCETGHGYEVKVHELRDAYIDWCDMKGINAFSTHKFNRGLRECVPSIADGRNGSKKTWKGVQLKPNMGPLNADGEAGESDVF